MRIALLAQPGLFADAVCCLLVRLCEPAEAVRVEPADLDAMGERVDLLVVDLSGEARAAISLADLTERSHAPVVVIADALDDRRVADCMEAGVAAVVPRAFSGQQALAVMREALADALPGAAGAPAALDPIAGAPVEASDLYIADNPHRLTPAEIKVLALLCEGCTNVTAAKRLSIASGTVKLHASHIYEKLGVDNRAQAIIIGMRMQIVRDLLMRSARAAPTLYAWLLPHMTHRLHAPGAVLFRKGERGNALYFIQSGRVALQEFGRTMGGGEFLGEIGIFSPDQRRTCTAVCETEAGIFALPAEQARRLYFENPQFAFHIVQLIAQRLARIEPGEPAESLETV